MQFDPNIQPASNLIQKHLIVQHPTIGQVCRHPRHQYSQASIVLNRHPPLNLPAFTFDKWWFADRTTF